MDTFYVMSTSHVRTTCIPFVNQSSLVVKSGSENASPAVHVGYSPGL